MSGQEEINTGFWRAGGQVARYGGRALAPAEVLLLVRYREQLSGRVLDAGCGAGRVLSYLLELGGEVHGVDISADMVERCRLLYPAAQVQVADLQALPTVLAGEFTAIVCTDNVIDVFDDQTRRRVLGDLHGLLAADGLLAFHAHNLQHASGSAPSLAGSGSGSRPGRVAALARKAAERPVADVIRAISSLPRRRANRRRLAPLEHREPTYAVLNDEAHEFNLLHYYIRRDDQERQLRECGFELIECLDADGHAVPPGHDGAGSSLLYLARRGARPAR